MSITVGQDPTPQVDVEDPPTPTVQADQTAPPVVHVTTPAPTPVAVQPPPVYEVHVAAAGERGPTGPPGPPGTSGLTFVVTAATVVHAMTAVTANDVGARPASSTIAEDGARVIGIAAHPALPGEDLTVVAGGALPNTDPMPVGTLYLGTDGALTPDPNTGVVQLNVAYAYTPNDVRVRIGTPIYHS